MSGRLKLPTGQRVDLRKSARYGAWLGCWTGDNVSAANGFPTPSGYNGPESYNSVTIRYPINYDGYSTDLQNGFYCDRVTDAVSTASYYAGNTPLYSVHTGGAFVLLSDGSVHFLSESMDLQTLLRLGSRQDGEVIGEF